MINANLILQNLKYTDWNYVFKILDKRGINEQQLNEYLVLKLLLSYN